MNSAKKLDDSCVPPNLPFNITNKTNKQTNTTKYKTKKWQHDYKVCMMTISICNYNAIANFFKFTTSTHCKYIQWNWECKKKLYFRHYTQYG